MKIEELIKKFKDEEIDLNDFKLFGFFVEQHRDKVDCKMIIDQFRLHFIREEKEKRK